MDSDDPYQAPVPTREDVPVAESQTLDALARRTFLAWEKLRIIYVIILVAVTLGVAGLSGFRVLRLVEFWVTALVGAVFANIAFFGGPVVETYVRWLGCRGEMVRVVLFTAGTFFACALAAFTVAMMSSEVDM